ncbi:hypothetical protein DFJ67_0769 [Asanoa ferruginea]|uniref:Uncharacterized protein n=1 Tax=Asanoa ferruginea TaxID=53367 RepID=A0A3D9ZBZ9_9ACTN|nr:hypothetical protein [Asanoa ferruginea]REF94825.1 hypothetical protein DFJ67_0769 [Asanoa ferruginea]GIF45597.1 hypothetical protein Afe04nite_01360 [Asanoa ferruginea]
MSFISFSLDRYNLPLFDVTDARYTALGAWIIGDISVYMRVCLDALAAVDDAASGRPVEPWGSDHYEVTIDANGLRFTNLHAGERGDYPLAEARPAIEEYWSFLVARPEKPGLVRSYWPELPTWQAELRQWEQTWNRRHPYRGRLFPATA